MNCLLCDHFHENRTCPECDCVVFVTKADDVLKHYIQRVLDKNHGNY